MKKHTFKVGFHRGNKRVWFQGGHLTLASFEVAAPYTVTITDTYIILALTSYAEVDAPIRKVSKKPSKSGPVPVIDLNSKKVSQFFGEATQCNVEFGNGWILIKTGAAA